MNSWKDIRSRIIEKNKTVDATTVVYKKVAASGVNMLHIIKPSFYINQLSSLSSDYINYVENFLSAEDRDWGEYIKFILYIREIGKKILEDIGSLEIPLAQLIEAVEEIFEGEQYEDEDEYEDELEEDAEPEDIEEPENTNVEDILKEEEFAEEPEEQPEFFEISREEMSADYDALRDRLRSKIRIADVSSNIKENLVQNLSKEIADVYLECIQLAKSIVRIRNYPEGDISELLSILVDMQYGLCVEMRRHLMEDIIIEDRFQFEPGLLTWTAHFLANFSDKINEEWYSTEPEEI